MRLTLAGLAALILISQLPSRAFSQGNGLEGLLQRQREAPQNALLCEQIGVAYVRLGDLNEAAAYFRRAVALDSNRVTARKNLATVLWFRGEKNESVVIFESLERVIPNDSVPQLYLGLNAYEHKEMKEAAARFERAGATATDNPETLPLVVESWLASNRADLARHLLEARVASGVQDAQIYSWLGSAYDRLQQPDKALAAYSNALRLEPKREEGYLALAGFSLDHGNPAYARKILDQGIAETSRSARLLLEMGLAWAIQGDFERARPWLSDATAARSDWSLPLLALGVTDLQTGNAVAAVDSFRKAKQLAPDDYRCFYLHAIAIKRSHDESDAAARKIELADLQRAIELDRHLAKARVALAEVEIADGNPTGAEKHLRAAIEEEPAEPSSYYRLGLLCRREGKSAEAAHLLHTFEQLKAKSHSEESELVLLLRTRDRGKL